MIYFIWMNSSAIHTLCMYNDRFNPLCSDFFFPSQMLFINKNMVNCDTGVSYVNLQHFKQRE